MSHQIKKDKTLVTLQYWARTCKTFKIARESIPNLPGRYHNPICRTGPPGYIGWRNPFVVIDSSGSIPGLLKCLQIRAQ